MFTTYNKNGREAGYLCYQMATTFGAPRFQPINAHCVDARRRDDRGASALRHRGQPSGRRRRRTRTPAVAWTMLERASYETALARRRYNCVDPANRLVARTLEREWEAVIAAEQKLDDDHHRALRREPERLTEDEKPAVRRLADDVPALLSATSTTASDRQAVARLMLDRVVILVHGSTEHADLTCYWAGGVITGTR